MLEDNFGIKLIVFKEQSIKLMLKDFWAKTHVDLAMILMFTFILEQEPTFVDKKQDLFKV